MFSTIKPKLPYQENGWNIYVTQKLNDLNILDHDKVWVKRKKLLKINSEEPVNIIPFFNSDKENLCVPWNGFKIQKVRQACKKLYTTNVGACYALCAQIDDADGQLSHIGLAHCFTDHSLAKRFYQEIITTTQNQYSRIDLFICGGNDFSKPLYHEILKETAMIRNLNVVHDVSMQLNKGVLVNTEDATYQGSIGISKVEFDDHWHPRLRVDVEILGLDLEKVEDNQEEAGFENTGVNQVRCNIF